MFINYKISTMKAYMGYITYYSNSRNDIPMYLLINQKQFSKKLIFHTMHLGLVCLFINFIISGFYFLPLFL